MAISKFISQYRGGDNPSWVVILINTDTDIVVINSITTDDGYYICDRNICLLFFDLPLSITEIFALFKLLFIVTERQCGLSCMNKYKKQRVCFDIKTKINTIPLFLDQFEAPAIA